MTACDACCGRPPPIPEGVSVRVYGWEYDPFSERVRLALTLKGVSFDVINCDLKNKPLFFLEANPLGEVPVIIHDGVILTESEVCVDYIDQVFGNVPLLYPREPVERAKVRILMARYTNKVIPVVYSALRDEKKESIPDLLDVHEKYVQEPLKQLGTPFFGGQTLNAVDIHVWPFLEMIDAKSAAGQFVVSADRFPVLIAYIKRMKAVASVKEVMHSLDDYKGFWETWKTPGPPDYNYNSKYPFYTADKEL